MVQTLLLAGLALAGVALCLVLGAGLRRVSGPARRRDDLDGVAEASTAPTPDLPVAGGAVAAPVVAAPVVAAPVVAVVAERTAGAPVAAVAPAPVVPAPVPPSPVLPALPVGAPAGTAPVLTAVRSGMRNNGATRFGRAATRARPTASSRLTNAVPSRP